MNDKLILYKNVMLFAAENFSPSKDIIVNISGYNDEDISYAIKKLSELGFVKAIDLTDSSGIEFRIVDITSSGWELIDKLKTISDKELVNNYKSLNSIVMPEVTSYLSSKENLASKNYFSLL